MIPHCMHVHVFYSHFEGGAVFVPVLDAAQVHIFAVGGRHSSRSQRCISSYSVSSSLPNKSCKTPVNNVKTAMHCYNQSMYTHTNI